MTARRACRRGGGREEETVPDKPRGDRTDDSRSCQGQPSRGGPCSRVGKYRAAGVPLCSRHFRVLIDRGGVRIRRTPDGPIEAIVAMFPKHIARNGPK